MVVDPAMMAVGCRVGRLRRGSITRRDRASGWVVV